MKTNCKLKLLFISIVFFITSKSFAQSFCGTSSNYGNYLQTISPSPAASSYCVNIFIHVMRHTDGSGGVALAEVNSALDVVRADFLPHGISFNLLGFEELEDDSYLNTPYPTDDLNGDGKFDNFAPNSHSNAIDIYIFKMYDAANFTNSYAAHIPSTALVFNAEYGGNFDLVNSHYLSHEIGHCLGLYHTFHGTGAGCETGCKELVNGSNGGSCGDYVGDTPADPGEDIICLQFGTCIWTSNSSCLCGELPYDINNEYYNPDVHLIMAYSSPLCQQYFSSGQSLRMRSMIANNANLQNCVSTGGADLWMQDFPNDLGVEPNYYNAPLYASEDIWNREHMDAGTLHQNPYHVLGNPNLTDANYIYVRVRNRGCEASSGNEEIKVYWAKASTGLAWPTQWINYTAPICGPTIFYGDEITNDGSHSYPLNPIPINVPILDPGQYIDIAIPWWPVDATEYACFGGDQVHFCLLARIVDTSLPDEGMTFTETATNWLNVRNNNNIAWKNVSIINIIHEPVSGFTIVRNVYPDPVTTKISFNVPEAELSNSFFNYGTVKIHLDTTLFQKWTDGGEVGEDIEVCNDTLIHLLSPLRLDWKYCS